MVRRPNLFDQAAVAAEIEALGYPPKTAVWAADWLKLAVPMVFKELGPERITEIVIQESLAVGLTPAQKMLPTLGKALAGWSESVLVQYQAERSSLPGTDPET